jgi:hypothetical protein
LGGLLYCTVHCLQLHGCNGVHWSLAAAVAQWLQLPLAGWKELETSKGLPTVMHVEQIHSPSALNTRLIDST